MSLLGGSMKIISLLMTKISGPKEKCQSEKYEYKVIFPYKNTLCFLLPHSKTLQKWLRVFTKGFTAKNVKVFYGKLTSSGLTASVLKLDRVGLFLGMHVLARRVLERGGVTGTDEPNVWHSGCYTVFPLEVICRKKP
jgi:hypothetical protein